MLAGILIAAAITLALVVAHEPDAKLWLAAMIDRAAKWATRELRARAAAQAAASVAWKQVYRHYRGTGLEAQAAMGGAGEVVPHA